MKTAVGAFTDLFARSEGHLCELHGDMLADLAIDTVTLVDEPHASEPQRTAKLKTAEPLTRRRLRRKNSANGLHDSGPNSNIRRWRSAFAVKGQKRSDLPHTIIWAAR